MTGTWTTAGYSQ